LPTRLGISGLTVRFEVGGSHVVALDNLSLDVAEGEFVTVIGANGAGKTTLANAIAGSVPASGGDIRIGGRSVLRMSEYKRSARVARVSQDPAACVCMEFTVEENFLIALTRGQHRSLFRLARTPQRRQTALAALAPYRAVLGEGALRQDAGLLSGGQRQLLALAMAVCVTPDVLLLDEHTSALDPRMAEVVMSATEALVRRAGLTTIMVTHHMGYAARYGDRLLIMSAGRIVDQLTAEERAELGESGLIERFRQVVAEDVTDRMLA